MRRAGKRKRVEARAVVHERMVHELPINARVAPVEVDDPYAEKLGEKIVVFRSLRDDPLGLMESRRQLDGAQVKAGRYWQRLFFMSRIGDVKAMDPAKPFVDSSRSPDVLRASQMDASDQLSALAGKAGLLGGPLLRDVLGYGMFIEQAALIRQADTQRKIDFWGMLFRETLTALAQELGYQSTPRTTA